jgi:cysteate synthase
VIIPTHEYPHDDSVNDDGQPRVSQKCSSCGRVFSAENHLLYCLRCGRDSLLVSQYAAPLFVSGPEDCFASYATWLPYRNVLGIAGPHLACVHADELGRALGLPDLWVAVSGYSPLLGSTCLTGTFKECEAIGILNRVREQTDRLLIVSSAGNAGRAFLELGARHNEPAIVVLPERAKPHITRSELPDFAPLLILIRDACYPDAIRFVDRAISDFPEKLVREGGCYNIARRDSMAVPFLRAVRAMGRLPDRYVQAVGSGTGAIAAWESSQRMISFGLVPYQAMRLLLVQNSPFTPMVDAWISGKDHTASIGEQELREHLSQTYAYVLSNATPPYGVRGGVRDVLMASGGGMQAVCNEQIQAAQALAARLLEFVPCNAASAALAGLIKAANSGVVQREEKVLLHLTGGGMTDLERDLGGYEYARSVTIDLNDPAPALAEIKIYLTQVAPAVGARGRI